MAATMTETSKGRWIPWIFVAGFAIVCLVNGTMIWLATNSWTGLVTERPYDKGLGYNRNLSAEAAQAKLGWQARLRGGWSEGGQELVLDLTDATGLPLDGALVEGTVERPLREGQDVDVVFRPMGGGRYQTQLALAERGQWQAHLRITKGQDRLVLDQRLDLR